MSKEKKNQPKVRDLEPNKDATGGSGGQGRGGQTGGGRSGQIGNRHGGQ